MNWLGLWTLYKKETYRFMKVYLQTIIGPVFSTGLFLVIFSLALGRSVLVVREVSFVEFLVPGLIMMSIIQNAFGNSSSSIMIAKAQGCLVDVLMAPLRPSEFVAAYSLACVTRGLLVGLAIGLTMYSFIPLSYFNPFILFFYAAMGSFSLGIFGIIASVTSTKFDQLASYTNFIITPLSFLSGTFYSIDRLNGSWSILAYINPFFYMIDGFRYGLIGSSDAPLYIGMIVLTLFNILLWLLCQHIIRIGHNMKN